MPFENIIGQNRVKLFLQRAVENGRISHAYLFVGDRGVGKEAVALEFAKGLLCPNKFDCNRETCPDCTRIATLNHPDLHFIFPAPAKVKEEDRHNILASIVENPYNRLEMWSNPSISIEHIREFRRTSSYKSFEGKGRVVIMADCERMTTEAANALLKSLEEPPERTYLLLISSRPSLLLPTITSRCQELKFDPLTAEELEQALVAQNLAAAKRARLTARMAAGSYRHALELLDENLEQMQQKALEFVRKSMQNQFIQIQFVEEIINSFNRDLHKIKELLKVVTTWFRDAMLYRETGDSDIERLMNSEQVEAMKNFSHNFPDADLYQSVLEVEKSLELIDRHVQVNLILIVLLNKLRSYIRK